MKCPNCNETDHGPGAKYCHVCGVALWAEPAYSDHEVPIAWVDVVDFEERFYKRISIDRFDLSQLLVEFENYIDTHHDLFDVSGKSIYIEEIDYKMFLIHLYDLSNKKVMQSKEGFSYHICTKALYHTNNVKSIFKNEKHKAITCRIERIPLLQKRLLDNTLTF